MISAFVVVGFLAGGLKLVLDTEGYTGNEGVMPGPAGLRVAEGEQACGSGGCARTLLASGDHAHDRMRDYLASRGFTAPDSPWTCRITGLLLTYQICAMIKDRGPDTVQVTWRLS